MKAFYYIIAAILIVAPWVGNAQMNTNSLLPACAFDDKTTCVPQKKGTRVLITDAADATCAADGAAVKCVLEYDGSAWGVPVAGLSTTDGGFVIEGKGTSSMVLTSDDHALVGSSTTLTLTAASASRNVVLVTGSTAGHLNILTGATAGQLTLGHPSLTAPVKVRYAGGLFLDTGPLHFSGTGSFVMPQGDDCPATCSIGSLFMDTDENDDTTCTTTNDNAVLVCRATNTWTVWLD